MEAHEDLVHELLNINIRAAVEAALDHTFSLLRLNPTDPIGMRCIAPFLLIRLNCDQDCYDFCKWWITVGNDSSYEWKDVNLNNI